MIYSLGQQVSAAWSFRPTSIYFHFTSVLLYVRLYVLMHSITTNEFTDTMGDAGYRCFAQGAVKYNSMVLDKYNPRWNGIVAKDFFKVFISFLFAFE